MQVRPFGSVRWAPDGSLAHADAGACEVLGALLDVRSGERGARGAQELLLAAARVGMPLRTVSRSGHDLTLELEAEGAGEPERGIVVRVRNAHIDPVDVDAVRGLSSWVRRIAHDYNNVFGAILGEADLLALSEPEEETRAALAAIERGVEGGLRLRERLVVLGRLSTERSGSADPAKFLARWQARWQEREPFEAQRRQEGVVPTLTSTLEPIALEGFDPGHLQLALDEVLDNAALAARAEGEGDGNGGSAEESWIRVDGGVSRVVAPGLLGDAVVQPGNWRWLRISDSGRGPSGTTPAQLRRSGVSGWPRGIRSGLGLAMASAAMASCGGMLALELAANVHAPRGSKESPEENSEESSGQISGDSRGDSKSESAVWLLLPVDDHGLTRRTRPDSASVST